MLELDDTKSPMVCFLGEDFPLGTKKQPIRFEASLEVVALSQDC